MLIRRQFPREGSTYDIGNMSLIDVNSKEIEYGAKGSKARYFHHSQFQI